MRMTLGTILIFAGAAFLVVGSIVGLILGLGEGDWAFLIWAWAIGLPTLLAGSALVFWSEMTGGRPLVTWIAIATPGVFFMLGGIGGLLEGELQGALSAFATASGFGGWAWHLYRKRREPPPLPEHAEPPPLPPIQPADGARAKEGHP